MWRYMDADWIKARLKERGYSIADFARAINRERAVASKIIHGDVGLKPQHAAPLAALIGVTPIEVLRMVGLDLPPASAAPVVQWESAPQFADVAEHVAFPDDHPRIFVAYESATIIALDVPDDAMDWLAPAGSKIVVDYAEKDLVDGELGVFRVDGAATFRRYRCDARGCWLAPDSADPRIPVIEADEADIVGRVAAIAYVARRGRTARLMP